jgi:hypothetical protein
MIQYNIETLHPFPIVLFFLVSLGAREKVFSLFFNFVHFLNSLRKWLVYTNVTAKRKLYARQSNQHS